MKKVKAGKFIVIKKNSKVLVTKKANKNMVVHGEFEVIEKTESKLTKAEKEMM